ncbi:hypothetical protein F5Y09DRAFT_331339 [Xylaria sp. FL1042]|nr:hypothetical protein F5Y09DRAFT_331339 [Xylaria sp. FL1042]
MTQPLTAEEEIRYAEIIDGILATADLETVTRKKIRSGLQAALGGKDLSEKRAAIKTLIEQRFDAISDTAVPADAVVADSVAPPSPPNGYTNGHDHIIGDEADLNGDEIKVSTQPPKKKPRKEQSTDTEDADAKLAALLQAEENQRTRTTRGGGAKAAPKKKKQAPKKKSDKRIRPEDDSDVDGSDEHSPKKRKAGGGFQKPFNLSYPLAELCGEPQLSRPQVVKKLWEHIKGNQLQDPNDKRQILCDERMQAIFKVAKVDMFQMNKLVGNHLYPNHGRGGSNARGRGRGTGGRGRGRGHGNSNAQSGRGGERSHGPRRAGGGGRGGAATAGGGSTSTSASTPAAGPLPENSLPAAQVQPTSGGDNDEEGEDVEAEVCFICASPVVHQSVAPCNHRTCHICALRMRALYKNKECAHCRTVASFVIFTDDATKRYEDYSDRDVTSTDDNIGIRYTNEDIVGDTVLLLRYNCPDTSCDFAGLGWPDLHRHVRSTHNKKMCDLCTRNKKVFTHEHELFADKELEKHMRHGDDRPGAVDQTGFRGHPLCAFCGSRFYDDDKLYEHCRNKHERCFLCDREDPRQPHYYRDYNSLEEHFKKDHYLCPDRECLEKKFVVFGSEMDLKAHQLSEHGNSLSKDVRREARLVDLSGFDVRERYQQQQRRGGGSNRGRDGDHGGRNGRGRGRDPNAEPLPASSAQPLRRDELALQRQMAIHSSQSVSNRTFGGQLSSTTAGPSATSTQPSPGNANASNARPAVAAAPVAELTGLSLTDANLSPEDRARLMRHSAVIERASNLLHNDKAKIEKFRSHISSFRQDKLTASGLVDALLSLFTDISSSALGTLVREVADLFEDKAKGDRLRKTWNDWRAINEDYPTLPGLSGMRGATTSSSGWAAAAATASSPATAAPGSNQRHTTRVLKLKNSTQQSRRSSVEHTSALLSGGQPSRQVASPAVAFPSLPPSGSTPSRPSSGALWGATASRSSTPAQSRAGVSREEAFPALPAAPKPTTTIFGYGTGSVRRDLGGSRNTGFSWGGGNNEASSASAGADEEEESTGKGKKGNKGRKKVLVQWG